MRYRWLGTAVALGLILSLAGPVSGALAPQQLPAAAAVDARERPNVLLILTDDQRAGTVVGMPHVMSELVAGGTTYPNAFVPTAWCCPSRASLLTGKFAHNSGVWENASSAWGAWTAFAYGGQEADTLATRLDGAGYRTGLFGKYLNDATARESKQPPAGWDDWVALLGGNYQRYKLSSDAKPVRKDRRYLTDELTARTLEFIRSTSRDTPFFALYAPFAPHFPFDPGPYAGATRRAGLLDDVMASANYPNASTNQTDMTGYPNWMRRLQPNTFWDVKDRRVPRPMTIDQVVERQADTLMAVDAGIGRMIDELRRSNRLDNTLIVFVSDNGYAWGDHRLQGKNTPYDVSVRVPLIMRYDGVLDAGATDDRVVAANIDVHATILDIVGVTAGRIDGASALDSTRDGLVMEAMRWTYGRPAYCGYRTVDALYVQYATGEEELYDYTRDPFELTNVADDPDYGAAKALLRSRAQQSCVPAPPGFTWDGRNSRLSPPTHVRVVRDTSESITVTWRAPSGVGAQLPEYRVYLGRSPRGPALCTLQSTRLREGLSCTIQASGQGPRSSITVAAVRGGDVAAAKPTGIPRRADPQGQ